jgi:hypothetical protein
MQNGLDNDRRPWIVIEVISPRGSTSSPYYSSCPRYPAFLARWPDCGRGDCQSIRMAVSVGIQTR